MVISSKNDTGVAFSPNFMCSNFIIFDIAHHALGSAGVHTPWNRVSRRLCSMLVRGCEESAR